VVPQGGRVEAAGGTDAVEVELTGPVDDVTELLPAHQVDAVEYRQPGKYSKVEVTR